MIKSPDSKVFYQLIEKIGQGSYGVCYSVVNTISRQPYALKIVKQSKKSNEFKIHGQLQHENVVKLFQGWKIGCFDYAIMEMCMFGTVNNLLKHRKTLQDPEVRYITKNIVSGLIYLHDNLIIHGDLKLTNLLISSSFIVKIGDFGLSKQLAELNEKRVTFCGTKQYIAPEIFRNKGCSFPADIWALGCIIYVLLEGKTLLGEKNTQDLLQKIRKITIHQTKQLSTHAWKLLRAIFVIDPSLRPAAYEIMNFAYFKNTYIPDQLDISVFYKQVEKRSGDRGKRAPLTDKTNAIQPTKPKPRALAIGKENYDSPKVGSAMKLRPRKKLTIDACEDLETSLRDGGRMISSRLLQVLITCPPWRNSEANLKKSRKSFLCVGRWVAGISILAYNLTDGSFSVSFEEKFVLHRTDKMETRSFLIDKNTYLPEGHEKVNVDTTVKITEKYLNDLTMVGTNKVEYKSPVLIVARKFFPACSEHPEYPTATFLLSNGSCQINFANHEKLLVNACEDYVVLWNEGECRVGKLSDILVKGPSAEMEKMLQFVTYSLMEMSKHEKNM